jgi:hypothetical protein
VRVSTPIADMKITVERITVEGRTLVMTNGSEDSMPTRTVMTPSDVRYIFGSMLRPSILWFFFTCLFRSDTTKTSETDTSSDHHPTPNPW